MPTIYDCSVDSELLTGTRLARAAIGRGELIVLPTDTVYGVGADAFNADAVARLLEAKGRGRQSPPPVLIPGFDTLDALAETVPDQVRDLVKAFWPGGLTVVLPAQPSLAWDLGETRGTVALRMPDNTIALELLAETGPLAVSSANKTGKPAATTAQDAADMLEESVAVYLDGGHVGEKHSASGVTETSSTIVDATPLASGTGPVRILRHGVISEERMREAVPAAFEWPVAAEPDAEPEAAEDGPSGLEASNGEGAPGDGSVPAEPEAGPDVATAEPEPERAAGPDAVETEPEPEPAAGPDAAEAEPEPEPAAAEPDASDSGAQDIPEPEPAEARAAPETS